MAVCWIAVVMVFFTFSTTQEYYSMPIYPALALLVGSALASENTRVRLGMRALQVAFGLLFVVLAVVLVLVWRTPAPGDISQALVQHPELYTLSLGHFGDLTLSAFAYLKLPLLIAGAGFAIGFSALTLFRENRKQIAGVAMAMIVFLQAARIALIRFDNYLGSFPLARALEQAPPGQLIEADAYYAFSSVFFYTNRTALLLNGRRDNLEYGSYAPGAPQIFIDDEKFEALWAQPKRCYLLAYGSDLPHLAQMVPRLHIVARNADNYLLSNLPVHE